MNRLLDTYDRLVLGHPRLVLASLGLLIGLFATQLPALKLDASADSLVLEGDKALEVFRDTAKRYGSSEFLVITYRPHQDLMSDHSLARISALKEDLSAVPNVASVISLLDVPLLYSPPVSFTELNNKRTLRLDSVDRNLAREELRTSPIYRQLILSDDGQTTAIQVNLSRDARYEILLEEREALRAKRRIGEIGTVEALRLDQVEKEFKQHTGEVLDRQRDYVGEVRRILDEYRNDADIFLGGVPMIAVDMIALVRNDLVVFGSAILVFIVALLAIIFRRPRWVLVPLLTCLCCTSLMLSLLAWLDWRMTVISSNFVALLLILTLSVTVHLVVRYRELHAARAEATQRELLRDTVAFMAIPCLYTSLTTIVAFASLVVSGIKPVIDFGWMMTIGVSLALVLAFLVLPCCLVLLEKTQPVVNVDERPPLTLVFARITDRYGVLILLVSVALALLSGYGITRLEVENRFIDYFDRDTEIYQGMVTIDRELGGTIPLTILIDAKEVPNVEAATPDSDEFADDFADDFSASEDSDFSDEFADDFDNDFSADDATGGGQGGVSIWFTGDQLNQLERIHDHLESLPETGKVLSLATLYKVGRDLLGGRVDDIQLAIAYKSVSDEVRDVLIRPYLDTDIEQTLISIRVKETSPNLRRAAFLAEVRRYLEHDIGLEPDSFELTGMLVLYNNMLQSLFRSQILTIGAVFVAILLMFMVLFRSLSFALLSIAPNLLAAATVLGAMGLFGIPLDMMTITIAAIVVGIGVDNAIHYVHRFRREFPLDRDYRAAMYRCHGSIGRAMYYTSVTIIAGFSILSLSNFRPSIYFGLLTATAMLAALAGSLLLLPRLILLFQPLGSERVSGKPS